MLGTPGGEVIPGATLSVTGAGVVTANAAGEFRLDLPATATVKVTAPGYLTRETNVRGALGAPAVERSITIELLADRAPFSREFFRSMAYNTRDAATFGPTYQSKLGHLTRQPVIYVDDQIRQDDGSYSYKRSIGKVPDRVIAWVQDAIAEDLPFWSDGAFQADFRVQNRPCSEMSATSGAPTILCVTLSDACHTSYGASADRVVAGTGSMGFGPQLRGYENGGVCLSLGNGGKLPSRFVVSHEFGHAIGAQHVVLEERSVMNGRSERPSELDRFHYRLMRSRPNGSSDLDVDPSTFQFMTTDPMRMPIPIPSELAVTNGGSSRRAAWPHFSPRFQ